MIYSLLHRILFFFVFFSFFYTAFLCFNDLIIYIFTKCHVSPLTHLTWLTLRVFSHNMLTSCHAPVSLNQSEPELESWRPIGGGLVTCHQPRGEVTHHISSPSVQSPGHVASESRGHHQHLITERRYRSGNKTPPILILPSLHIAIIHFQKEKWVQFPYFVVTHKTFNCCVWPSSGYDSIVSGSKC